MFPFLACARFWWGGGRAGWGGMGWYGSDRNGGQSSGGNVVIFHSTSANLGMGFVFVLFLLIGQRSRSVILVIGTYFLPPPPLPGMYSVVLQHTSMNCTCAMVYILCMWCTV
jgi:hypothetical protein